MGSPERRGPDHAPARAPDRAPAERLADHREIGRLADELIPALIARLGASGLGEVEVREGDWKVRLRRPADAAPGFGRRLTDRGGRTAGAPTRAVLGEPGASARPALLPVGPGRSTDASAARLDPALGAVTDGPDPYRPAATDGPDPYRAAATSPAVGYYQPRSDVRPGSRVRHGDPIASIDVLGIPQEVVSPADGIVGASMVQPGDTVEYGQQLLWVELLSGAPVLGDGSLGDGSLGDGSPGEA